MWELPGRHVPRQCSTHQMIFGSEDGSSFLIRYCRPFPDVRKGPQPIPPRPHIQEKSVACHPLEDLQKRISGACYVGFPKSNGEPNHSSGRTCCLCGREGLSDNKADKNSNFKHVWSGGCPASSHLKRLVDFLASGMATHGDNGYRYSFIDSPLV